MMLKIVVAGNILTTILQLSKFSFAVPFPSFTMLVVLTTNYLIKINYDRNNNGNRMVRHRTVVRRAQDSSK